MRASQKETNGKHLEIVKHYESCLKEHGDTHKGVDWPNKNEAIKRYQVMYKLFSTSQNSVAKKSLLDFGCGAGHFLDFLKSENHHGVIYTGQDISEAFINLCRNKYPNHNFICGDILTDDISSQLQEFDFIICNGVFTEKLSLSFEEMYAYFISVLTKLWPKTRKAIAFNLMSKNVDWERDDLFHVPLDRLTKDLSSLFSREFSIMHNYGLYEYTVYLYRTPQ